MPKKPSTPFGYIAFSKDGKVKKHVETLSSDKADQEKQVGASFIASYNAEHPERQISECIPLPENDHDFVLRMQGEKILLQVTELVDRSFVFPMSQEEYDKCEWREAVVKPPDPIPWRVDTEKRDAALYDLISRKQAKRYSKEADRKLWLLIFTTSAIYKTEYISEGRLHVSEALMRARAGLAAQAASVFDEIWFTNMIYSPVRVWPPQDVQTAPSGGEIVTTVPVAIHRRSR